MTSEEIVKSFIASGDVQGLYESKRGTMNVLADPRVLAHLRSIHQRASESSVQSDDNAKLEHLTDKITAYNRRNGLGSYTVIQKGLDYEGPIHVSLEGRRHKVTKVLQITNVVTVQELLPLLAQKFNISKNDKRRKVLYQTLESDEILLSKEECPLEIVVNAEHNIRFLLKMDNVKESTLSFDAEVEPPPGPPPGQNHKHLSKFFGVSSDELNEAISPSVPSNLSKWKGVPGWFKKHQGDDLSLSSSSSGGSGQQGKATDEYNDVKGLMLNPQTPLFRRKSETLIPPLKIRTKSKKEKHKRPKSITEAFEKRFTRRKKDTTVLSISEVELSFDECTPGIIKVFGEEISSGATYKSVLASEQSTAEGIIKEILDRYSLSKDDSGEYVLCDVVGRLDIRKTDVKGQRKVVFDEGDWQMEYFRIVENNEKPLLLQSFWKPCDGCARRFEIRRRSTSIAKDQDNVTSGLNANAKRFQMHRTKVPSQTSSVDSECSGNIRAQSDASKKVGVKNEREETESSDEHSEMYHLPVPLDSPYLINIKGSGDRKDLLCYRLNSPVTVIGCSDQITHHADIILSASDIFKNHCKVIVQSLQKFELEHHFEEALVDVFLEPFPTAVVHVNGHLIEERTQISSGDLIGIGSEYLFIFKNPTEENGNEMSWLDESLNMNKLDSSIGETCVRNIHPHLKPLADEYDADLTRIKIIYSRDVEDDLLRQVLPMACVGEFPLIAAFVFSMCIEYTAYHHDQDETKALICKVANLMQNEAWLKTKTLASSQPEKPVDVQEALVALIPDLRPIIIWMSNSLELLNHLQQNIHQYIVNEELSPRSSESTATIDEEVLSVLEEIVMYTFQQTVYYLTKTLYIGLPAVLDSSPFINDDDSDEDTQKKEKILGINAILSVFQATFDLLKSLNVHRQIVKQLFAYLLFFTNASLFNMLMERGPSRKCFKWSKGVQIRGNLNYIEGWIQDHGLQDISHFLALISTTADLLATPKIQLLQATWSSLRHDFPHLNPAQLQQVLGEYQLGPSKTRPKGWYPPTEEVEDALKTDEIFEGFNNHPPLMLPSNGFVLQLRKQVTNTAFYSQLQALSGALPSITIETGNAELQTPRSSTNIDWEETKDKSIGRQSPQLTRQENLDALDTRNDTEQPAEHQSETDLRTGDTVNQSHQQLNDPKVNYPQQSVRQDDLAPADHDQNVKMNVSQLKPGKKKQDMRNSNVQTNGSLVAAQMRRMEEESSKRSHVQKIRGEAAETKRTPSYCSAMDRRRGSDDTRSMMYPSAIDRRESEGVRSMTYPSAMRHRNSEGCSTVMNFDSGRSAMMHIDGDHSAMMRRDSGDGESVTKVSQSLDLPLQHTPMVAVTPPDWDKSIALLEGKPAVIPPPPGWTSSMEKMSNVSDLANNNMVEGQGSIEGSKLCMDDSSESEIKESSACSAGSGGSRHDTDDVFVVDLEKENGGVGLGLIDGMFTPLRAPGIYVRTLLPAGPASKDGQLRMGDRILAVNGTSLVGADYQSAMQLIRGSGIKLRFLIARSDNNVAIKISNSSC